VLIDRRVGVELKIDARDDAGGHRHALAADRITVSGDSRLELRDSAERQRRHILQELRRGDFDEREIAVMRDEKDRSRDT
jgi:hypothetical protein